MTQVKQSKPAHLLNVPKDNWPETIIQAVTRLFLAVFPERIRAVYVSGSQSDQSAASFSDIDAAILFKCAFQDGDEALTKAIIEQCRLLSPLRLDIWVIAEDNERFRSGVDVRLKLGSQLVWGEDVRASLPLPSLSAYQEHMRQWVAIFLTANHDIDEIVYPLQYPDPEDEFYGYTQKRAIAWYPPDVEQGTKELVATVCWTATALLAFEAEIFIASRAECLQASLKHLDPQWAELIGTVYKLCKVEWDYRVPEEESDRRKLRELCGRTLHLFNYYVGEYHEPAKHFRL